MAKSIHVRAECIGTWTILISVKLAEFSNAIFVAFLNAILLQRGNFHDELVMVSNSNNIAFPVYVRKFGMICFFET